MQTFTIACDYDDAVSNSLQLFVRFTRSNKLCHVARRKSATQFLTREDAEAFCPSRGYHVDPRAKSRAKGKGKRQ